MSVVESARERNDLSCAREFCDLLGDSFPVEVDLPGVDDFEVGGVVGNATTASEEERVERRAEMARSLARGGMEDVQVLSLETAQRVLTPKRYEIIEVRSREDVASVSALARRVDRDKAQVSRDLHDLAEYGIIRYDTDGRAKRPRLTQAHIVLEPLV